MSQGADVLFYPNPQIHFTCPLKKKLNFRIIRSLKVCDIDILIIFAQSMYWSSTWQKKNVLKFKHEFFQSQRDILFLACQDLLFSVCDEEQHRDKHLQEKKPIGHTYIWVDQSMPWTTLTYNFPSKRVHNCHDSTVLVSCNILIVDR